MVRREQYANKIYPLLLSNIDRAISEIYVKDLGYRRQTKHPKQEQIDSLLQLSEKYSKLSQTTEIKKKTLIGSRKQPVIFLPEKEPQS